MDGGRGTALHCSAWLLVCAMAGSNMMWAACLLVGLGTWLWWRLRGSKPNSVVVMVLGDFGRSPRMQVRAVAMPITMPVCV